MLQIARGTTSFAQSMATEQRNFIESQISERRRTAPSLSIQFPLTIVRISKTEIPVCTTGEKSGHGLFRTSSKRVKSPAQRNNTGERGPRVVSSKFQTWSLDSRHALYPARNTDTHTAHGSTSSRAFATSRTLSSFHEAIDRSCQEAEGTLQCDCATTNYSLAADVYV